MPSSVISRNGNNISRTFLLCILMSETTTFIINLTF